MTAGAQGAATLQGAIRHVVLMRSEKQVLDAAARRGVAGVTHAHIRGDRTTCQLPDDSVSKFDAVASPNHAVPVLVPIARPRPASVGAGTVDLRPEVIGEPVADSWVVAESSGAPFQLVVPIAQTSSEGSGHTTVDMAFHVDNISQPNRNRE
jgi:hypothetical protein